MRVLLLAVLVVGCGQPEEPQAPARGGLERPAPAVTAEAAPKVAGVELIELAKPLGGIREAKASNTTLHVRTAEGRLQSYNTRCGEPQLLAEGPVVGELLDADDRGNAYVFAEGLGDSKVVRLSPGFEETPVVEAGRGIWEFTIAPEGDVMAVSSCGPTGVLVVGSDPLREALAPPATLWEQTPSVLTSGRTFWSLGYGATTLVRTTPEGSQAVADTSQVRLSRCGAHVCGTTPTEVLEWDEQGALVRRVPAPEGTTIVSATGDRLSLFLVVATATERKLVRVPPGSTDTP